MLHRIHIRHIKICCHSVCAEKRHHRRQEDHTGYQKTDDPVTDKFSNPSKQFFYPDLSDDHKIPVDCINDHKNCNHIKEVKIRYAGNTYHYHIQIGSFLFKYLIYSKADQRKINTWIDKKRMFKSCNHHPSGEGIHHRSQKRRKRRIFMIPAIRGKSDSR